MHLYSRNRKNGLDERRSICSAKGISLATFGRRHRLGPALTATVATFACVTGVRERQ
jgi:hypothetical protein